MPQLHTLFEPEARPMGGPGSPDGGQSTGGLLGASLGQGLAVLLQGLAQSRAKQAEEKKQMGSQQEFLRLLGLGGEEGQLSSQGQISQGGLSALTGQPTGEYQPIQWSEQEGKYQPEGERVPTSPGIEALKAPSEVTGKYDKQLSRERSRPLLTEKQLDKIADISQKKQEAIDKEASPVINDIVKQKKGADDDEKRLDRMTKLIGEGKFGGPLFNAALDALSPVIDLSRLKTADAQEFDKLSKEFLKNITSFFPGRLLDSEVKAYMKTVPGLMQSKAGMKRVINSMKAANAGRYIRYEALKDILKETGGKRPADLEMLIEERAHKQLDVVAKAFIDGELIPEEYDHKSNIAEIAYGATVKPYFEY